LNELSETINLIDFNVVNSIKSIPNEYIGANLELFNRILENVRLRDGEEII
tara:strand:+ start:545 stop:697 length:153 start_codon:yes stop_codon:yes gene_type:complete